MLFVACTVAIHTLPCSKGMGKGKACMERKGKMGKGQLVYPVVTTLQKVIVSYGFSWVGGVAHSMENWLWGQHSWLQVLQGR